MSANWLAWRCSTILLVNSRSTCTTAGASSRLSAPGFYAKLTGGLIHGYREPYHKKIPFNHSSGWGVTAIPAVGYQFTPQWSGQVNILGKAGLMFQVNYSVR